MNMVGFVANRKNSYADRYKDQYSCNVCDVSGLRFIANSHKEIESIFTNKTNVEKKEKVVFKRVY